MDIVGITEHIYTHLYLTAKTLINKSLDVKFLENGLLLEFSAKNKIKFELFVPDDDYNCPVCYEERKEGETYFKLVCDHIVCGSCFSSLIINSHNSCPMCRREIELENCKINKHIDDTTFFIPEEEIDDMACEYTYEYIILATALEGVDEQEYHDFIVSLINNYSNPV